MKGYWKAVAVGVVGLLAALPPSGVFASPTPLVLNISFNIGPIAAQLDITKPVAQPATGVFNSTLHIHARDNTQTPPFNADLVATGQAADADTLLGGFAPAALIVVQDLAAGMTFQQGVADALAKTGVTVTFLNDPGLTEYALVLVLMVIDLLPRIVVIQPGLGEQLCEVRSKMEAGLAILQPQTPPDPCYRSGSTP